MVRNSIVSKVGEKGRRKSILEEIIQFGQRNRQLGLFLFIYWYYSQFHEGPSIIRLWRFYNNIAGHIVHENTVKKQVQLLRNKGLVEVKGDRVYPKIFDPEAVVDLFDYKRSRAGKHGALKRLRKTLKLRLYPRSKELEIPKNLDYYVRRVLNIVAKLVSKGRRWEALDLIVHTLLPLREDGILWLWRKDEFVYYEPKAKPPVRCARFPALAEALKKLGFKEGIMVDHVKGHGYAKAIIHRLFTKGALSWPWSRSIFYGLKKYGLADEGSNYIIELERGDGLLLLYLRDYYSNIIATYEKEWLGKAPEPLTNRRYYKSVVVGKQHVYEPNEESYFSRW